MPHGRVARLSHDIQPAADGIDREGRRIVVNTDTDTASIGGDVIDTLRDGHAQFLVDEIVHANLVGTALRTIVAASILVGTD